MTITIGAGATDRGSASNAAGYTVIDLNNPAGAGGAIDTVEVRPRGAITGCWVGIFYLVGGTIYKCRASVEVGDCPGAEKTTKNGLSLAVQAGDYIGAYWSGGDRLEADTSGGDGYLYASGEHIDPGDEATYYTVDADGILSLYGTGGNSGTLRGWNSK